MSLVSSYIKSKKFQIKQRHTAQKPFQTQQNNNKTIKTKDEQCQKKEQKELIEQKNIKKKEEN